jgi:hypothetical protein
MATFVALVLAMQDAGRVDSSVAWLPLIESAINDLVCAAIAVYFLHAPPPNRVERGQLPCCPTDRPQPEIVSRIPTIVCQASARVSIRPK